MKVNILQINPVLSVRNGRWYNKGLCAPVKATVTDSRIGSLIHARANEFNEWVK